MTLPQNCRQRHIKRAQPRSDKIFPSETLRRVLRIADVRSGRYLDGRARLVKNAEAFLTHRAIFVTLVQYFSVAGNDLLIPAKGFLLIAIAASGPVVIQVDIDETVTLRHRYQRT